MIPVQFRAWDKKGNCMLDWNCLCQSAFNYRSVAAQHSATEIFFPLIYDVLTNGYGNFICMQLTGERDKYDKEIWVSDVYKYRQLLVEGVRQVYKEHTDIVENSIESFYKVHCLASVGNCEVIGNIYENPELRGE